MRRKDRKIIDLKAITKIIRKCDVCRLLWVVFQKLVYEALFPAGC